MNTGNKIETLFNTFSLESYIVKNKTRLNRNISSKGRDLIIADLDDEIDSLTDSVLIDIPAIINHKASVKGKTVEYDIEFDHGNSDMFHYWPQKDVGADKPEGQITANHIYMYYKITNNIGDIKSLFNIDLNNLNIWLEALRSEAQEYNSTIREYISDTLEEKRMQLVTEARLENELNS